MKASLWLTYLSFNIWRHILVLSNLNLKPVTRLSSLWTCTLAWSQPPPSPGIKQQPQEAQGKNSSGNSEQQQEGLERPDQRASFWGFTESQKGDRRRLLSSKAGTMRQLHKRKFWAKDRPGDALRSSFCLQGPSLPSSLVGIHLFLRISYITTPPGSSSQYPLPFPSPLSLPSVNVLSLSPLPLQRQPNIITI